MISVKVFSGCALAVALSSSAFANSSVYTKWSSDGPGCKDLGARAVEQYTSVEGDSGPYEGYEKGTNTLCDGYKGYKVLRTAAATVSMQFGYLSDRMIKSYYETFGGNDNWLAGPIEWRLDSRGVPRATIIRITFDSANDGKPWQDEVLAISKVGQPDNPVGCIVGVVLTTVNKNANEIARQVADDVEPGFTCQKDEPQLYGKTNTSGRYGVSNWEFAE